MIKASAEHHFKGEYPSLAQGGCGSWLGLVLPLFQSPSLLTPSLLHTRLLPGPPLRPPYPEPGSAHHPGTGQAPPTLPSAWPHPPFQDRCGLRRGGAGREEPPPGAGGGSAVELRESCSEFLEFPSVVARAWPAGAPDPFLPSPLIRSFLLPPAAMEQPPAPKR